MDTFQLVLLLVSTGAAALSALASAFSIKQNAITFNKSMKSSQESAILDRSIQVMVHCNERYSKIQEEISTSDDALFQSLMEKYWSLKSDQFDYWLAGFVDHDSFFTWYSSTAKHFFEDDGLWIGKSFREGWKHGRRYHEGINPWFVRFVDCLELAYPKSTTGSQLDREYTELKNMISEMEGTPARPGLANIFRRIYSEGMTWEKYLSFNEDNGRQQFLAQTWSRLCEARSSVSSPRPSPPLPAP